MNNKKLVQKADSDELQKVPRPNRSKALQEVFHDGNDETNKLLAHTVYLANLPTIDRTNPVEVQTRIDEYWKACTEHQCKPTISDLAVSLGTDRKQLYNYLNYDTKDCESKAVIKKAYSVINSLFESWMQNGTIPTVNAIFLMKNNLGYVDQQEVVVTPKNPLGDAGSEEELQKRYLDAIPMPMDELSEGQKGAERK